MLTAAGTGCGVIFARHLRLRGYRPYGDGPLQCATRDDCHGSRAGLGAAVNEAVVLQTLVAERRAAQLAQAEERATVAERKQAEAEAKLAASQACGRVSLSLQFKSTLNSGTVA